MLSDTIRENFNIFPNRCNGFSSVCEPVVINQLRFEFSPEAFNGSVIVAVSFSDHRLFHSEGVQFFPNFAGTILTAPSLSDE